MHTPFDVIVYVGPGHDLVHTSRFFTGITSLGTRREIRLMFRHPSADDSWLVADPMVICFDIRGGGGRRIAVDLRDGLGVSSPIIDRVDRYFKRSFYTPEVESLPGARAATMRPFGLNYGCRSLASTWRVLREIGPTLVHRGRPGWLRVRHYLSTPGPSSFEQGPREGGQPKVVFQTRLWTANEVPPDEVRPLNEARVEMIRALRRAFGDQFVGGLVPTAFAREHYPDELTPHPSRYVDYLKLKKQCLVGVYTRGVEHSLAFKLGETLAAAQCLVSVPLHYELPTPLVAGENYLPFQTTEEAVAACRRLLDDRALAARMRLANHDYYRSEVEPGAHVRNILQQCTE